jgi:NAD(P) transhydrogenase
VSEGEKYDIVVIGAGPAGKAAAVAAALFNKRVVLIEKSAALGGAAINTGTLPSKTLRETALALSGFRSRRLHGVDLSLRRECTVGELLHHERMVKVTEQAQMVELLSQFKVPVIHGAAAFEDENTIKVTGGRDGEKRIRGDFFIISIGSAPLRPPLYPFDHIRVLDSDEIVEMAAVPKSLAVVGAGVIGSEYACTFAALGVSVDLIDGRDTLLPFLDLEVSKSLETAMRDLGIRFHWKEQVTKCEVPETGDLSLTMSSGKVLKSEAVLVAAGRQSHTEALNPEAAGLLLGKRGLIPVNEAFRTNVPNIYAVGDVIGFPALASTSAEQGRVAACHICESQFYKAMSPVLPTGIYTIPEIGMVGETEGTLKSKNIEFLSGRADYAQNPRGKIIGDTTGFLKLLFDAKDMKLLGASAIGEQATELIHVAMTALLTGSGADLFLRSCFNYPTLGDLYKIATHDALLKQLERRGMIHVPGLTGAF